MKTIAFFNNKGGVGKTSLVYHLSWMLSELGHRIIAADLDPQANLSGMFVDEDRLEQLWKHKGGHTVDMDIGPLFKGIGDISDDPHIERIDSRIGLLVGDMKLSKREDELSTEWPRCLDGNERAFRVTTAFARLIGRAATSFEADIVLVDVGPNLGAINRAALIASDFVVVPLGPDLFSLQGLRNVGPTLRNWVKDWKKRVSEKPEDLDIDIPEGQMEPLGYIVMRHSVRLSRPVQAYDRWIRKIPQTYRISFSQKKHKSADKFCLAHLKDYRSLMPMAQEARKAMFMLKPGDGAIGAHQSAVSDCYRDFERLAIAIRKASHIPHPRQ